MPPSEKKINCYVVDRITSEDQATNTLILMRGLNDARYSLVSGCFTILEAKKLNIEQCNYFYPLHLKKDFAPALLNSNQEDREKAFFQGTEALNELSKLPVGRLLSPQYLSFFLRHLLQQQRYHLLQQRYCYPGTKLERAPYK